MDNGRKIIEIRSLFFEGINKNFKLLARQIKNHRRNRKLE